MLVVVSLPLCAAAPDKVALTQEPPHPAINFAVLPYLRSWFLRATFGSVRVDRQAAEQLYYASFEFAMVNGSGP